MYDTQCVLRNKSLERAGAPRVTYFHMSLLASEKIYCDGSAPLGMISSRHRRSMAVPILAGEDLTVGLLLHLLLQSLLLALRPDISRCAIFIAARNTAFDGCFCYRRRCFFAALLAYGADMQGTSLTRRMTDRFERRFVLVVSLSSITAIVHNSPFLSSYLLLKIKFSNNFT